MKGTVLTQKNLLEGDVLLVEDWCHDFSHAAIALGQAIFSHGKNASSNVTHAGIFDGTRNILESSGDEALRSADFIMVHKKTKYQVYRYIGDSEELPAAASAWAKRLIGHRYVDPRMLNNKTGEVEKGQGFGRYGKAEALGSLFTTSSRGQGARVAVNQLVDDPYEDRAFYCSNFVVECYELACRELRIKPVIAVDYRHVSPKRLQKALRDRTDLWEYQGNYKVTDS
jgi:hypothetical protein